MKSILVKIAQYLLSTADKIDVKVCQLLIKPHARTSRPASPGQRLREALSPDATTARE